MALMKAKQKDGWMAVVLAGSRLDFAHIRQTRDGRPEVTLLESFERGSSDVDALKRVSAKLHLNQYRCTTLLNEGEYQLLQTDPPAVGAEEMKEALRWKIKDMVDFPVEAASVDVLPIPTEGAVGRAAQVFAVVAKNEVLIPRVQLFQEAKAGLEAIDIPELAQRNIAALFEEENRGLAMLALDNGGGLLTFTFRGELYVVRHSDVTLEQLQRSEGERREQLFEKLALDVQRSMDNFDRMNSHITLTRLLVSPVPGVSGFMDYLRQYVYIPVEELDLAKVLDFPSIPELKQPERQAQCLRVIGAALRD